MQTRIELSNVISERGPTVFSKPVLRKHGDLFAERSALVFTPTSHLPKSQVGSGPLNIFLPLCSPDFHQFDSISGYRSPRLWLDLIQRATGLIRWDPIIGAAVRLTRVDESPIRDDHLMIGMKALRDALKFQTSGRRDGMPLYYFGAIVDDDLGSASFEYHQRECATNSNSGVEIQIQK